MLSITEIKRKLPNDFIEEIEKEYSPMVVDKMLASMGEKRTVTIRVNRLKTNRLELMNCLKERNIKFDCVLWYEDAFVIKNKTEKELQKLEEFENGLFYMQSLSSMIPPLVLNPKKNEKILDMTAAPGSKTTQMASMMQNEGSILANELDFIRYERLKYNVEKQGASIVKVVNGRGEKLGEEYSNYFDKVLLDTPCSGEGRFSMLEPRTYRDWSMKKVRELVKVQKKLWKSAYQALKPNGIMVYSTCTINQWENEEILDWAYQNFNMQIEKIKIPIKEIVAANAEGKEKAIENAIKVLPSKTMEGFFVAKIRKKEI